ncbi:MAG: YezD family protein [Luteimonas sp.]
MPAVPAHAAPVQLDPEHERHVLQAIRETSFGTIEVTIHQSRIVQITRSEKIRF